MKGNELKLVAFMEGSTKRFVIPVYQRSYDWKTENCKRLFDDLVKVIRNGRRSHFFGSIVSAYDPEGRNSEFLVIDGQQRLTTVSLLFLAMYNLMEKGVLVPAVSTLGQQILETYLVNKWQPEETRIKLKPVKDDNAAFRKLFQDESEHIKDSNLTVNYQFFCECLRRMDITVDQLYDAICSLEIISIELNEYDNPQLIFESLNSTGVALSEGDKIRNYILMGLPSRQQNVFYEKYWSRIERYCGHGDQDVSAFVRDWLSLKQQAIPSKDRVYFTFKAFVEDSEAETEPLLQELTAYARRYETLLTANTADKRLNACIRRLNRLETTVTRPFFLEVLRLQEDGVLTADDTADIFLTTESYLFRRTICSLPTNALNKIFLMLHKEVIRFDGTADGYVDKFKYALLAKRERARFPDDEEFSREFEQRPVYLMNSKNKIYILERLENGGTAEDKDVYRHFDDGDYSIEHIMPQHLTSVWVRELGPDYEQIHEQWLHRIANLTLTAYNAKYSNSPFAEKRDRKNGFKDSGIRLNWDIARKDAWGLPELEERSKALTEKALTIWPAPVSAYRPEERQLDTYTLEDDVNLSGRTLIRYSYKGMEQPVSSWIDMYEQVLRLLNGDDRSVLSHLAYTHDDSVELAMYVSDRKETLRTPGELEEGLYIERNTSTWLKLSLLRRFFKLYGADPSDLVFYLKEGEEAAEEGSRYALRRRYWAYALDVIKAANDGPFSNDNPTKSNWVSGTFGIRDFSLCCVANYDGVRVELGLGRSREENKAAFDRLASHRPEIEKALGAALIWDRGENIKSSKVSIQQGGVSIEREDDWPAMAQFQAQWSRRFYDVLVPYLRGMPFVQ